MLHRSKETQSCGIKLTKPQILFVLSEREAGSAWKGRREEEGRTPRGLSSTCPLENERISRYGPSFAM